MREDQSILVLRKVELPAKVDMLPSGGERQVRQLHNPDFRSEPWLLKVDSGFPGLLVRILSPALNLLNESLHFNRLHSDLCAQLRREALV